MTQWHRYYGPGISLQHKAFMYRQGQYTMTKNVQSNWLKMASHQAAGGHKTWM